MHVVGSVGDLTVKLGLFDGHSEGLTRRPLVDWSAGSIHQALVHYELVPGGRIDRHLHAFEEGLYVLSGSLATVLDASPEELAVDDFAWIEVGVPHALVNEGAETASWLEVSAPIPGAALADTVFTDGPAAAPGIPYRRGHFDLGDLPEPSSALGLAGAGSANVGGASVRMLVDTTFGASQFNLMALRYVPSGAINEHDHAFEEAFFFVEGEIEALLDGEAYTLRAGDFCWSGVGSMHALTNRSTGPVRWLETQAPQPPGRHQFRYRGDWERLVSGA